MSWAIRIESDPMRQPPGAKSWRPRIAFESLCPCFCLVYSTRGVKSIPSNHLRDGARAFHGMRRMQDANIATLRVGVSKFIPCSGWRKQRQVLKAHTCCWTWKPDKAQSKDAAPCVGASPRGLEPSHRCVRLQEILQSIRSSRHYYDLFGDECHY